MDNQKRIFFKSKESVDNLEIEIKCLLNTLELIHHGYLALGQTDDDFATLELSFIHTLKSNLENICNNQLKEVKDWVNQL